MRSSLFIQTNLKMDVSNYIPHSNNETEAPILSPTTSAKKAHAAASGGGGESASLWELSKHILYLLPSRLPD